VGVDLEADNFLHPPLPKEMPLSSAFSTKIVNMNHDTQHHTPSSFKWSSHVKPQRSPAKQESTNQLMSVGYSVVLS
jgi:hypothetical protein